MQKSILGSSKEGEKTMNGKINMNKKDEKVGDQMDDTGKKKEKIVNFESFVKVLDLLADLRKKHEFKIGFPAYGIYVLAEKDLIMEYIKKYNVKADLKEFDEIVKEILQMVYIILGGNRNQFVSDMLNKDTNVEKKIDLVQSKIVDKEMREKYLLNKVYKTNILEEFDWEVVKKYYDKNESEVKDFPISVLRFRIRHTSDDRECTEKIDTFVFECTEYGIEELKRELDKIKVVFEKLKQLKE